MAKAKKAIRPRTKLLARTLREDEILFRGDAHNYLHIDPVTGDIVERVPTLGGFRRKSDVHLIEPMTRLEKTDNAIKHFDPTGKLIKEVALKGAPQDVVVQAKMGWVVDASWSNRGNSPITSFKATFCVPPAPLNNSDPLIYLFAAIERAQADDILQPVLKWGPTPSPSPTDERNCWSVYSTFISPLADTQQTTSVKVEPGQVLVASISLEAQSATWLNYICEFEGIGDTQLKLGTQGEIGADLWCIVALEAYNTQFPAKDYPNTTKSIVSHINIQNATGYPNVRWTPQKQHVLDSESINVVTDGAQNALVEIVYTK